MDDGKVVPLESSPPRRASVVPRAAMPDLRCPFCDSGETEADSIYGCHMMLAQYYCRACRSSFDWVRGD